MLDYAPLCCDSLVCESRCRVPAPTKLCANHLIKAINCLIAMLLTFGTHWTSPKLLDCQTSKDQCTLNSHPIGCDLQKSAVIGLICFGWTDFHWLYPVTDSDWWCPESFYSFTSVALSQMPLTQDCPTLLQINILYSLFWLNKILYILK